VKIIGKVAMDDVPGFYRNADFSILLREDKRYAHAGFPTKLVESLSCGVPLITNDTSDIKKYIKNGFNGFILENHSVEEIIECLENLILLSENEKDVMKENAKKTSLENFDFNQYSKRFRHFLHNIN
jgi:glycosyltransferase involved in cell wall biosynthesis